MQNLRNTIPVVVNVSINKQEVNRYAFYTPAFISENDEVERTVEVTSLKEVIDKGYAKDSNAYAYCAMAFSQRQRVDSVVLVAKRSVETYVEAYTASHNTLYYYITLESKELSDILSLSSFLLTERVDKLIFFTKYEDVTAQVKGIPNLVWWWDAQSWLWSSWDIVLWDSYLEVESTALRYPEAAWISYCANVFPSQIQWLGKTLNNVDAIKPPIKIVWKEKHWLFDNSRSVLWDNYLNTTSTSDREIDNENSSVDDRIVPRLSSYMLNVDDLDFYTWGSGKTCDGEWIDHKVNDDWIKWAIRRNVWKLLKDSPKISATKNGVDQIEVKIKEVLEFNLRQNGIISYKVYNPQLNRQQRKASFEFSYEREHAIVGVVTVNGTVFP